MANVAAGVISCLVSSWVLSNLGVKAVGSGRPARQSGVNMGAFVSEMKTVHNLRILSKDRSMTVITIDWLECEEGEFSIVKDEYSPSAEVGNR